MGIHKASLKKGGVQSQSTRPRSEGPLHQNEGYYVILVYEGIDGIVGEDEDSARHTRNQLYKQYGCMTIQQSTRMDDT